MLASVTVKIGRQLVPIRRVRGLLSSSFCCRPTRVRGQGSYGGA